MNINFSSKLAINRLAKLGAIGVPIATPLTCKKKKPAKVKQSQYNMYSKRDLIIAIGGKLDCHMSIMILIDSSIGIDGYREDTSAVTSKL